MKPLLIIAVLAGALTACSSQTTVKTGTTDTTTAMKSMAAEEAPAGGKIDPVCGMPYDTSFHEWAVYKTDTLHFCSPTCKKIYEKNPAKFAAKLGL